MPKPSKSGRPVRGSGAPKAGKSGRAAPTERSKKKSAAREGKSGGGKAGSGELPAGVLAELRVKIDEIDRKLIKLLNDRAKVVVKVGELKRAAGIPIYTPHREAEVLDKVLGMYRDAGGLLPERSVEAIYKELMSGSFALEQPLRIGYLGPEGSYSHLAAVKQFGSSVDFEDLRAIEGVFNEVARGHVDYGLAPIENSLGGGIVETMDAFKTYHEEVNIYAEVQIEIHHALLGNCAPNAVKRIYSKPEVFAQCRKWLATQYPNAEQIAAASSARAAQMARQEGDANPEAGVTAIGSVLAGEIYGLNPLFENIEDATGNITRFLVLSKQKALRSDDDKTSIMFITADEPGALVSVLSVFQRAGINLTHIDKRPSGRVNWSYTFFVDALGHIDDTWFAAAVRQAEGHCQELRVLGSYPRSKRIL